jgi:CelD/BcsL family acetyltransferase involved in cellulose biosynthesis
MLREGAIVGSARVELIDDLAGFTALRSEWNGLLAESAANGPFLSWEWLHAWWTHLRGGRALRLLTVRDGGELIGVAPLALVRGPLPWLSRLEFLGTGYAGSDYLDVIVRRDREADGLEAMGRAIASHRIALHLDHLPAGSLASRLVGPIAAGGWRSIATPSGICPFVPLAGHSWESYLGTIGSAHRANFRRRFRSLGRQFEVRFQRASSESERAAMLSTLVELHNRRWDKRGGSTAFPTPACRAFHDEATRLALESGWLRLYELRLDDRPVAATYCFAHYGRFYFYQGAFDERYRQHSLGLVAMGLTIRAAIEEGAVDFDMLYGEESYKWLWARETRPLERLELFPAHIGGRLHQRTVEAERTMRAFARRIFPRRPCDSNIRPAGAAC